MRTPIRLSSVLCLISIGALPGCGASARTDGNGGPAAKTGDMTIAATDDGGAPATDDAGPPNNCGDNDPGCMGSGFGPGDGQPFPLGSDPMPDPRAKDDGVGRDTNGWLGLDQTHATFDFLWIANSEHWSRGTVSKLNSKTIREVARYFSVTCGSLKTGSKQACDGTNGCCAGDDYPRFMARQAKQAEPVHQAVNLMANSPSRTAIDWNGDMFVANRAFQGQSSVTKVANDQSECIDRNKNGKIDTSNDANGDGLIQTDCNNNGVPDDLDDVKNAPCANNGKQEFFGLDDECVLWTTNTNTPVKYGRPLALGPGAADVGASDAWPGNYVDGRFFRVDGTTGLTKAMAQGPVNSYGATVDSKGIAWVAVINNGKLGYFDTANPGMSGNTRGPMGFPINAYGITMDRDQNVWQGGWTNGNAYRYTPDRSNGFANLGNGYWTVFTTPGSQAGATGNGRGIAADSRSANTYFIWLAKDGGWVSRIDATRFPPLKMDQMVDASMFPAFRVAGGNTIGVGVDVEQNVWGISQTGSVATRALVDKNGAITPPNISAAPMANTLCPAGDRCPLQDTQRTQPLPYTYSDFTGFGLRNFTRPKGTYSYVVPGCQMGQSDTYWFSILWDADVPPSTSLTVHARTGKTPMPDQTWGPWTGDYTVSPADLRTGMPLQPFDKNNSYLQVEFIFTTMSKASTPKLKSFNVSYKCGVIG